MEKEIIPLWTKKDVAKYFNKNISTIDKWVMNGEIKSCPNTPSNSCLFDPDYIMSFGRMDFKYGCSPEVQRLKNKYERELKLKNKEIIKLKAMIREMYVIGLKNMNLIDEFGVINN